MIEAIIFDNDDTLYKVKKEFKGAIVEQFYDFISRKLSISREAAIAERDSIFKKYRSTGAGLVKEHNLDYDEFVKETYLASPINEYIEGNTTLIETLATIPQRKAVLTNNPSKFAELILDQLGCKGYFSFISGEDTRNFILKPDNRAFIASFADLGVSANHAIIVDDKLANLTTAKALGAYTVLIGNLSAENMLQVDYATPDISNIKIAIQRIENLDNILKLCKNISPMQSGSTKCTLHVGDYGNYPAVLKIAHDASAEAEIMTNTEAYNLLKENAPKVIIATENILVLEDLRGKSIEERINRSKTPNDLYQQVAEGLKKIYTERMIQDPQASADYLKYLFGADKQGRYFELLQSRGLIGSKEIEVLKRIQSKLSDSLALPYTTFATGGELQPEHLFIRDDGSIVILDPKKPFIGIPIIDLVSFSNLFSIYNMRNAEDGQRIIKDLCKDLGNLCQATPNQIEALMQLSTLRQMSLSARFRHGDEAIKYAELAKKALYAVEEILK